jgi:hypothetical protein
MGKVASCKSQISSFEEFGSARKSPSRIGLGKKIEFQAVTVLNYFRTIFVIRLVWKRRFQLRPDY